MKTVGGKLVKSTCWSLIQQRQWDMAPADHILAPVVLGGKCQQEHLGEQRWQRNQLSDPADDYGPFN